MSTYRPGDRLDERYLLQRMVGAGGMGEVWAALDLRLDRRVAIKILHVVPAGGMLREARAAARLSHPSIAAVHDYVDRPGSAFLVMELLEGATLADRLHEGPLPRAQAYAIATQAASALAAAHAAGIVHQDVKPANIMLTAVGVKILDFGLAVHSGVGPDQVAGTPAYAPPERLYDHTPHPAGDVYSLAVVVHEMLTGRPPWPVTTWAEVRDLHTVPERIPSIVDAPDEVADLLQASLSRDPARRPSAGEFHRVLERYQDRGTAVLAATASGLRPTPTLIAPPVSEGVAPPSLIGQPASAPTRIPRSPGVIALAAMALLLVVVGLVAIGSALLRSGGSNSAFGGPSTAAVAPSHTPSAEPTEKTVEDLINELQATLQTAVDAGTIDESAADDISKSVPELNPSKSERFVQKVQDLRDHLAEKVADDEFDKDLYESLDAIFAQLISQANATSGG